MQPPVPFRAALAVWARVGLQSFGGPAGQIAVMHRIVVEEKNWLSERRFLHALQYCMLLPGPEAMQLATYTGWLLHGVRGGLVAGALFILPGFVAILVLSLLYALFQETTLVAALFFGLKAAVLAIIVQAVWRIGRRALGNAARVLVAVAAFVAIFFLAVPFPLIIVGAAIVGVLAHAARRPWFDEAPRDDTDGRGAALIPDEALPHERPRPLRSLATAGSWLAVWWAPVAAVGLWLGWGHVLTRMALFFSQVAVVTFGGAYAVLAYVAQRAVDDFGWVTATEMVDGLGMAEATPGPLIQVLQFVGFLGAWGEPGPFAPLWAALLASVVVTWVLFAPSFLFIFVGAPYVEALRGRRGLHAALAAVTAAVVGVIMNLAAFFALHVLFGEVSVLEAGPLRTLAPVWATVDRWAVALAAVSLFALFRLKWGMLPVLGAATAVGFVVRVLLPA